MENLLLLLQLCSLLLVSRVCGEIARYFRQPAVLGELGAGLLLGPSFFGWFAPQSQAWLFPKESGPNLLSALALIGVCLLLTVTGLEIDLPLIGKKARAALWLSFGGLLIPCLCGFAWGWFLPEAIRGPGDRMVIAMFAAVALSISAIPVVAKVLMDLGALRSDLGQLILAAAMIDDSVGWMMLSVVAGVAANGHADLYSILFGVVATGLVFAIALGLGPTWIGRLLAWVDRLDPSPRSQLSTLFLLVFIAGAITQAIGLEAGLGAFLMGLVVGQSRRLKSSVGHSLEQCTMAFFSPLFFASAGLRVDLISILQPPYIHHLVILLLVASLGKFGGCYLGGRKAGLTPTERLVVGAGMNPRGAMGVIVATLGLQLGVIQETLYSLLVAMALLTSLAAPPILRHLLKRIGPLPEPAKGSFSTGLKRILLPTRGGENSRTAAQLLSHIGGQNELEVTTLIVGDERPSLKLIDSSAKLKVIEQFQKLKGPLEETLLEAAHGYDLMILGATDTKGWKASSSLFEGVVDKVLQAAPCPTLVVRASRQSTPLRVQHILVPVVGSHHSHHSVDLAAWLAGAFGSVIHLLHIIPPPDDADVLLEENYHRYRRDFGQGLLDSHADELRHRGLAAESRLVEHAIPEQAMLDQITDEIDMIVLGCNLRPLSGRAFLGHRVERVLREASCTVLVISAP